MGVELYNKPVVPLLGEYDSDGTMNVVREEKKADQVFGTSIVKVHHGASTILEEDLGLHLDMYNATARLSFWLMMKENSKEINSGVFKAKLKGWLKCNRRVTDRLVAMEILQRIGHLTE